MGEYQLFPNDEKDLKDPKYKVTPPPEWFDDDFMEGLFGPLNKSEKIEFWRTINENTFTKHPTLSKYPVFSLDLLNSLYRRKGLTPLGLRVVIDDMIQKNEVVLYKKYMYDDTNLSGWVLNRALPYMMSLISPKKWASNEEFVYKKRIDNLVKSLTNELEKEWAFKSDCLVLFDEIKTKFPEIELLIPQMRRQQRVILFEVFGKKVLKFIDNKHSNSVTDIDRGVSALKITFTKLETQLSRLLREQLAYKKEAKEYYSHSNKKLALSSLKKAKNFDLIIEKTAIKKENILSMIISIQQAESLSEVQSSLKSGVQALKIANNEVDVDSIFDLTEEIKTVIDDQNEKDNEWIASMESINEIDESEENELLKQLDLENNKPVEIKETEKPIASKPLMTTTEKPNIEDLFAELTIIQKEESKDKSKVKKSEVLLE